MVDRKSSQTKTFSKNMIYMFCLDHFSPKCIIKNFYLISDDPLKGTVFVVIIFVYFFLNSDFKMLWYWEQCLKISGLYDKKCACGTHLKFMRHPHYDDSALS